MKWIQEPFTQSELTVINVWNSSCTSCEKEMGILESLSQEYAGRGVQILGLIQGVTDVKDADSLAVVNSAGINYTQLLDSEEFSQLYLKDLGPLPSTILLTAREMSWARWKAAARMPFNGNPR